MEFAKPGEIQRFCLPNSILSFNEYLLDYGDEELRRTGDELIHSQTASIEYTKLRNATLKKLADIELGKRDLHVCFEAFSEDITTVNINIYKLPDLEKILYIACYNNCPDLSCRQGNQDIVYHSG